jgi:hypothetical protein
MKKSLIAITVISAVIFSALTAFASGGFYQYFSDVTEDDWFASSVHTLYGMDVVEGYDDGTYQPSADVNRAELAVMLDRFYDYIEYPYGDDWEEYENDYYSVMLPHSAYDEVQDCNVGDDLHVDIGFNVSCYSSDDYSVSELVDAIGEQFEGDRRVVTSDLEVNDENGTFASITTVSDREWQIKVVYIEDFSENMIYAIYDAGVGEADDFEYFYSSFKIK